MQVSVIGSSMSNCLSEFSSLVFSVMVVDASAAILPSFRQETSVD